MFTIRWALSHERCRSSHNAELRHVIQHPIGIKYFTEALKKEFSQENIDVRVHPLMRRCQCCRAHRVTYGCVGCGLQFWDRANNFRLKYMKYKKGTDPSMAMLKVGDKRVCMVGGCRPCPVMCNERRLAEPSQEAREIYVEFVDDTSKRQINIKSDVRATLERVRRAACCVCRVLREPRWRFPLVTECCSLSLATCRRSTRA